LRNLRLGKTAASVSLADGALTARLDPIALYGGIGRAELDVDDRGAVPTFRNTLKFDRIALQPLLSDTLGVRRIEGIGFLTLDVTAQGTNPNAVMHTLWGRGSLAGDHGRIRGVDLAGVARTIQSVLGGATGTSANTDFLDMNGTFVIANGVLTNKDFRVAGPLLSMTGAGAVDIGNAASISAWCPGPRQEASASAFRSASTARGIMSITRPSCRV
jgi:AsmA protein